MVQVETPGLHRRLAQAIEVVRGGRVAGGRMTSWFSSVNQSHWKRRKAGLKPCQVNTKRLSKSINSRDTESVQVPLELATITWHHAGGWSGYNAGADYPHCAVDVWTGTALTSNKAMPNLTKH